VIVSQLARSPGVFFEKGSRLGFPWQIIPLPRAWVEFEYDQKNCLYVRIDRKRILGTDFPPPPRAAFGGRHSAAVLHRGRLAVRDKSCNWTVDATESRRSAGHEADALRSPRSLDEIVHSGRKVTASILKEIQKAKITENQIDTRISKARGRQRHRRHYDRRWLLEANSKLRPNLWRRCSTRMSSR